MQIVSFCAAGRVGWGVQSPVGIIDLSRRFPIWPDVRSALAGGFLDQRPDIDGHPVTSPVTLLPPVPNPERILCVGLNYRRHVLEMGRDLPAFPTIFTRHPGSIVGHGQPIIRPRASIEHDYEGELAVVIGRGGRHIAAAHALDHVAGYACFNDGSIRDWQRHTTQFTAGKNFMASGAFGPALVTCEEAPAIETMHLRTRLNGTEVQHGHLSDLIFDVPALIAYVSTFAALEPGDVIVTGTPDGVGAARTPPLWMRPGDRVEVEISGLGVLSNPVEAEAAA